MAALSDDRSTVCARRDGLAPPLADGAYDDGRCYTRAHAGQLRGGLFSDEGGGRNGEIIAQLATWGHHAKAPFHDLLGLLLQPGRVEVLNEGGILLGLQLDTAAVGRKRPRRGAQLSDELE